MRQTNREMLFDAWAKNYDPCKSSAVDKFPFSGYDQVLDAIVQDAKVQPDMRVLDLGIGTGNLTARLIDSGSSIWGIDFSIEMLNQAQIKFPKVTLIHTNLLDDWPSSLHQVFDVIVSAYVFHEFDLDSKLNLIKKMATQYLSYGGHIIIGDIAFQTVVMREQASKKWSSGWDKDEYYWAADETLHICKQIGLYATYKQISSCGGVFSFALTDAPTHRNSFGYPIEDDPQRRE